MSTRSETLIFLESSDFSAAPSTAPTEALSSATLEPRPPHPQATTQTQAENRSKFTNEKLCLPPLDGCVNGCRSIGDIALRLKSALIEADESVRNLFAVYGVKVECWVDMQQDKGSVDVHTSTAHAKSARTVAVPSHPLNRIPASFRDALHVWALGQPPEGSFITLFTVSGNEAEAMPSFTVTSPRQTETPVLSCANPDGPAARVHRPTAPSTGSTAAFSGRPWVGATVPSSFSTSAQNPDGVPSPLPQCTSPADARTKQVFDALLQSLEILGAIYEACSCATDLLTSGASDLGTRQGPNVIRNAPTPESDHRLQQHDSPAKGEETSRQGSFSAKPGALLGAALEQRRSIDRYSPNPSLEGSALLYHQPPPRCGSPLARAGPGRSRPAHAKDPSRPVSLAVKDLGPTKRRGSDSMSLDGSIEFSRHHKPPHDIGNDQRSQSPRLRWIAQTCSSDVFVSSRAGSPTTERLPGYPTLTRNNSSFSRDGGAPAPVTELQGTMMIDESGSGVLCQFEIMAELGSGNFGKVYLVTDADGELFALKTLRRGTRVRKTLPMAAGAAHVSTESIEGTQPPSGKAIPSCDAVEREIAIMKRLNHPNIVKLHALIEDPEEGQTHLVMQYVDNGPIGKLAPDNTCRPLPFTLALKYMTQVARGLNYLHSQNIIHRDIKPENILIGSDDTAYLSDFGVSSIISDDDVPRVMAGTMSFFSPELVASHSALEQYGKESDVWAFGVTLYCLLFGKLPFTGRTGPLLVRSILMDDLQIPDFFPEVRQEVPHPEAQLTYFGAFDSVPFLSRHPSQLKPATLSTTATASALHRVPEALKEILRGLLNRNPAERLSLRAFRHAAVVRHPNRFTQQTTHPVNGLSPPPPSALSLPTLPESGADLTLTSTVVYEAGLQPSGELQEPPIVDFFSRDVVVATDPLPLASSGDAGGAAESSTDSLFQSLADELMDARAASLMEEELLTAVVQCNVVLSRHRGSIPPRVTNESPTFNGPSASQGQGDVPVSHVVQRLRDQTRQARKDHG